MTTQADPANLLIRDLKIRIEALEYERDMAESDAAYWEEYAHDIEDRLAYYEHDDE